MSQSHADTDTYRLVGTALDRGGEHYDPGDVIEPTENELDTFGAYLEPAPDAETDDPTQPDDTEGAGGGAGFDAQSFVDHTTDEIDDMLQSGEYDQHLSSIREAEASAGDRSTVMNALDSREDNVE